MQRLPPNPPRAEAGGGGGAEAVVQKAAAPRQHQEIEPLPATEAAAALQAINVKPAQIAELAYMPLATVEAAIADGRARPGVRDMAGWVVSLLRTHREYGWKITPATPAPDSPEALRDTFARYTAEQGAARREEPSHMELSCDSECAGNVILTKLPFWLATISPEQVNDETRPKLIQYQIELADILARLFYGELASPAPLSSDPAIAALQQQFYATLSEMRRIREAIIIDEQRRTNQAVAETRQRLTSLAEIVSELRTLRLSYTVKQTEVAARLGVQRAAVTRWERGTRGLAVDMLLRIADTFGIPASRLLPERHQERAAASVPAEQHAEAVASLEESAIASIAQVLRERPELIVAAMGFLERQAFASDQDSVGDR